MWCADSGCKGCLWCQDPCSPLPEAQFNCNERSDTCTISRDQVKQPSPVPSSHPVCLPAERQGACG